MTRPSEWTRLLLVFLLTATMPAIAQDRGEPSHGRARHPAAPRLASRPRANQGRIPPPPPRRESPSQVEEQRHENGKVNGSQHVDHDHWYGHDAPSDARFRLDRPFEHGHFAHAGPDHRYRVLRFDRDHRRFWLPGGFCFEVASWDWFLCSDWCWDCGDDFVVYDDPDHLGWYVLYNIHTGVYVHVTYMGT